jgi:short subunit dehydrogenase-like uncharacterized protein
MPRLPVAYINPAVIHRTAVLASPESLRPFCDREGVAITRRACSATAAVWVSSRARGLAGVAAGRFASFARNEASRRARDAGGFFRASGYGPESDRLEGWEWSMSLTAHTTGGQPVGVRADGLGHPGYLSTARMLGETGLLLCDDAATPERAGYLTPAAALGTASIERFERAGLRFTLSG